MKGLGCTVVALALALPGAVSAQIASRVAETEDGVVRFAYPTRDGVEICEQGIRMGEHQVWWRSNGRDDRERNCRPGPAVVELTVRGGAVRELEVVRDLEERARDAVDLGEVGAREAADYLLTVAREGRRDAAEDAVFPVMLADVPNGWEALLDLAEDRSVDRGVRKSALFWLGQEAADAATAGLQDVALDGDEDQEVRDAAVFALSQREPDEAIPVLIDVARTGPHAETRRRAMFWLAQMDDARVVDFFQEVLLGSIR